MQHFKSFGTMVEQLMNLAKTKKTISKKQYEKFCNEYIFQAVLGNDFGVAFCKKFDILDYVLITIKDTIEAKRYIKNARYVRNDRPKLSK